MKIVNIDGEALHIFWTTSGISLKFSGKMWVMIILKFTKKQGLTLSLFEIIAECVTNATQISAALGSLL